MLKLISLYFFLFHVKCGSFHMTILFSQSLTLHRENNLFLNPFFFLSPTVKNMFRLCSNSRQTSPEPTGKSSKPLCQTHWKRAVLILEPGSFSPKFKWDEPHICFLEYHWLRVWLHSSNIIVYYIVLQSISVKTYRVNAREKPSDAT